MIEIQENMKVSKSFIKYVEYQELKNPVEFPSWGTKDTIEEITTYRVQIVLMYPDGSGMTVNRDFNFEEEAREFYRRF